MSTRVFVLLLVGVLVLGGGLGGAFTAGMALGKSQGEKTAGGNLPARSTLGAGQQLQGQPSQEQLDQLRRQFQGQLGQGPGGPGFVGGGGLTGIIEEIEGNTVTVDTQQGPLQVTVGADTTIQMLAEGTLQDLLTGMRVTVVGQRGEGGTVTATSILITPEGAEGFWGGGFLGGRQQDGQPPP